MRVQECVCLRAAGGIHVKMLVCVWSYQCHDIQVGATDHLNCCLFYVADNEFGTADQRFSLRACEVSVREDAAWRCAALHGDEVQRREERSPAVRK